MFGNRARNSRLRTRVGEGGVGDVRLRLLIGVFIVVVPSQASRGQRWHCGALGVTVGEEGGGGWMTELAKH